MGRMFMMVALVAATMMIVGKIGAEPLGTSFNYQGRLILNGNPIDGPTDFVFTLWDEEGEGSPPEGGTRIGPIRTFNGDDLTPPPIDVVDGLFTVTLDFLGGAMTGEARWLEISVAHPSGSELQTLTPRQTLRPTPHALALPGMRVERRLHLESPNVIGGFSGNQVVGGNVEGATISGGGHPEFDRVNRVLGSFSTIGGGRNNEARFTFATIGGGESNVTGGEPLDFPQYATIGGGQLNQAEHRHATVGGGRRNVASGRQSTVAGGGASFVGRINLAAGESSTVGGGAGNQATGDFSTVAGGEGSTASGAYSTVSGGGFFNEAAGMYSTVPGGLRNLAIGNYSFAAGREARANHHGAFVWGDSQNNASGIIPFFQSTGNDQFIIRARGGVGIGTNAPASLLHLNGSNYKALLQSSGNVDLALGRANATRFANVQFADGNPSASSNIRWAIGLRGTGQTSNLHLYDEVGSRTVMVLTQTANVGIGTTSPGSFRLAVNGSAAKSGGGSWSNFSDARLKRDIQPAEPGMLDNLLQLRGYTFEFEEEAVEKRLALPGRQIGILAHEVEEVFPDWVDADGEGYLYVTERGLTAIIVEALRDLRAEKDAEIARLEARLDRLEDALRLVPADTN